MSGEMYTTKVNTEDLLSIALLKCNNVVITGDKNEDCDERKLPLDDCCGTCFAKSIVNKYLSTSESKK